MKHWVEAARLRTLPLSVSGIILGSAYAFHTLSQEKGITIYTFNWYIFGFAMLTTLGLQILSNFANDYGDSAKGTDNEDRVGPKRGIQLGVISPKQMKIAIIITAFFTFTSALLLIYFAFGDTNLLYSLFYFALGLLALVSAVKYTVGKKAYGYRGYGDIFVFVFFGLVSTLGVYFMFTKKIDFILLLPASAIGLLSVGVLNMNNMRDEYSDRKAGKNTFVVKIGNKNAKKYQNFIILSALFLILLFAFLNNFKLDQYFFLVTYFPLLDNLIKVRRNKNSSELDKELKKIAVSTFLLSIILSLSIIIN